MEMRLIVSYLSHSQDFNSLSRFVSEQHGVPFLNYMSDFHLLYHLYTASPAGIDFKVSS